jgi:hypothetical protein
VLCLFLGGFFGVCVLLVGFFVLCVVLGVFGVLAVVSITVVNIVCVRDAA